MKCVSEQEGSEGSAYIPYGRKEQNDSEFKFDHKGRSTCRLFAFFWKKQDYLFMCIGIHIYDIIHANTNDIVCMYVVGMYAHT